MFKIPPSFNGLRRVPLRIGIVANPPLGYGVGQNFPGGVFAFYPKAIFKTFGWGSDNPISII